MLWCESRIDNPLVALAAMTVYPCSYPVLSDLCHSTCFAVHIGGSCSCKNQNTSLDYSRGQIYATCFAGGSSIFILSTASKIAPSTTPDSGFSFLPANLTKFLPYGLLSPSNTFKRSNLLSRNRFFGSIPLTAFFNTSPPPHLPIIASILMLFRLPGRVLCV